jgi:hypothetical protein
LLEPFEVLGEIGHHIASIHFAVDKHVDTQFFLLADPELRRLAFRFLQRAATDPLIGEVRPGFEQEIGFGKASHRCDGEKG